MTKVNDATRAFMADLKLLLDKHGVEVGYSADYSDSESDGRPQLVFSSKGHNGVYISSTEEFMELHQTLQ